MAEAKAQKARRVLVTVVSSYDSSVVWKAAIDDSVEFREFLNKELLSGDLDSLDIMDITTEVEEKLGISIPEEFFATWKDFFDKIIQLLNEG